MRRLICIFLLMCLSLQSFALHAAAPSFGSDTGMAHELDHDNGVRHHHEDDGSVHYDNSDESAQHIQDHSTSAQAGDMATTRLFTAHEHLVLVVKTEFSRFIPEPYLDSPLRPPAPALGLAAEG